MVKKLIITSTLFFAYLSQAFGDARLEINPTRGTTSDMFIFQIIADGGSNVEPPLLSGGDDFRLTLQGRQNSIQIINGTTTSSIAFTYRLFPKKSGELKTPGVEVTIDGQTTTLSPLTVHVTEDKNAPADASSKVGDPVFVTQAANKRSVYRGEQIVNTIELFSSINLINPRFDNLTFDGFWMESLGEDTRSNRYINQNFYNVVTIRKALFPLKADPHAVLPPRDISASVLDKRLSDPFRGINPFDPNFFDNFFGDAPYTEKTFRSDPVPLEVKELPAPPSKLPGWNTLTPLVGDTSISVSYDNSEINVGESKTVTVTVSSTGNLNPLKELPIQKSSQFRIYAEAPTLKPVVRDVLESRKTFKISIVPIRGGTITLPPFEIGYFNPKSETYEVAKSDPIEFHATGDSVPETEAAPAQATPEQTPPNSPPLKYQETSFLESITSTFSTGALLLSISTIVLLAFVFLAVRAHKTRNAPRAQSEKRFMNADTPEMLYREAMHLMSINLNLSPSIQVTRTALKELMTKRDLHFEIDAFLEELEGAAYGASAMSPDRLSEIRTKLLSLIRSI